MMNAEPEFAGVVAGITVPVTRPNRMASHEGNQGVSVARMIVDGAHRFVNTLLHSDGEVMSGVLDEEALDRFAHSFALCVEAAHDLDREPSFPVHH